MTVSNLNVKTPHTGDGIQTNFSYNFYVVDADHFKIYLDDILYGGAYTVNNVGTPAGGSVDITVPPADLTNVTLIREVPLTQQSRYRAFNDFPAETVESDFDLDVMRAQEREEELSRAIKAPVSDDGTFDYTLPQVAAGKSIKANGTGDGWIETTYDPDTQQAGAATSAAAALVSELAAATSAAAALVSELAAAASAASINLPAIQVGDENKILRINSAEDGYDLSDTFIGNVSPSIMTPSTWPSFRAAKTTTQTNLPVSTWTKVAFGTEEFDTNNDFDSDRFTPTAAGKFLLIAQIFWIQVVSSDVLNLAIYKNGMQIANKEEGATRTEKAQSITALVNANGTTDYFEIFANPVSRATSDILDSDQNTNFAGCRIG